MAALKNALLEYTFIFNGRNADFGGDVQRLVGDFGGGQVGVLQKRAAGSQCKIAAAADGDYAVIRLDHFARSGKNQAIRHPRMNLVTPAKSIASWVFALLWSFLRWSILPV